MITLLRYLGGLVLCYLVAVLYTSPKFDNPRDIIKRATVSFLYDLAILFGVALVAYIWVMVK